MRALLLDAAKCTISEVTPCELEEYQELIGCRCIDIVNRGIAGKRYDIICDDEGLFSCDPRISAIDDTGQPMLAGNLIIAGETWDGNLTDLSEEDIRHIRNNVHRMQTKLHPEGLLILCQMQY